MVFRGAKKLRNKAELEECRACDLDQRRGYNYRGKGLINAAGTNPYKRVENAECQQLCKGRVHLILLSNLMD